MAGILFSCVNDLDAIEKATYSDDAADEVTQNLEILYTDSGYAQVRVQAALAETDKLPKHITRLKDGLRVDFFENDGKIGSTLTALYGEVDYATGIMFVKDSVVLYNYEKKQWLETEELFYNQNDSTIHTSKYYVVKTEGKGITGSGEGMRTTPSFRDYETWKPVGAIDQ
ncbi:MAG: hypothetical protein Crog4KO_34120 [Crocinitomicaceae bacterium]